MKRKDNKEKVESQENLKINYMQIIEQSDQEKLTMYMKLSKKELATMLIMANKHIERMPLVPVYVEPQKHEHWPSNPFNERFIVTCTGNT